MLSRSALALRNYSTRTAEGTVGVAFSGILTAAKVAFYTTGSMVLYQLADYIRINKEEDIKVKINLK